MEEVVSLFVSLAGIGSARSYTTLALQAMSRHFGNLRDAIMSQINVIRTKSRDELLRINCGLSQLSLFDRDSRQNRLSLQHLGMIPRQSYPTDSEKLMLASQTGLTKNQISNWFINARVRLWKPMIEEMYKEEFEDSPHDSESSLATED